MKKSKLEEKVVIIFLPGHLISEIKNKLNPGCPGWRWQVTGWHDHCWGGRGERSGSWEELFPVIVCACVCALYRVSCVPIERLAISAEGKTRIRHANPRRSAKTTLEQKIGFPAPLEPGWIHIKRENCAQQHTEQARYRINSRYFLIIFGVLPCHRWFVFSFIFFCGMVEL